MRALEHLPYSSLTFIRKAKSVPVSNTFWDNGPLRYVKGPPSTPLCREATHPDRSATQIAPNDAVVLFGVSLCCFYISLQMFVCLAAFDVSLCGCSVFQCGGRRVIVVFFFFSSQMLFTVLHPPPLPPDRFCASLWIHRLASPRGLFSQTDSVCQDLCDYMRIKFRVAIKLAWRRLESQQPENKLNIY